MRIESLGHVVIKVRDVERSEAFYNGVLGLPIVARSDRGPMTFFSLGDHHDFAIAGIGDDAEPANGKTPGLAHVAFKIGNSLEQLKDAKRLLDEAGIQCAPVDHEVTQSLYFADPDGNQVELYVDVSDVWKQDPQRVAQASKLEI
ncbi:MAG: VOC family protein [Gammaproteobacteria bacterium]|nr:VOC family protein [Gammaproteobacteria bacterium]